ncbi:MAG: cytochrome c biogenesis protein CcsA [Proteobacteria bacterium]|nr:cytochrome c biogenesis protein CcsA [Pseudomonadota bacterium]
MPPLEIMLLVFSLFFFLASSGLFVGGFHPSQRANLLSRLAQMGFVAGTLTVTLMPFFNVSSSGIWLCIVLGWLSIIAWRFWNLGLIGTFMSPIVSLILLLDSFFATNSFYAFGSMPASDWFSIKIHIGSAVIGQAFAAIACSISLLLLWQERKLKSRDLISLPSSYPAMKTLASSLSTTLWIGFTFITISLITGAIVVKTSHVTAISLTPKIAWAIMVWAWYLSILVLAKILSYRPHKIARMSLVGFALLALSWFGMAFTWNWGYGS